MPGYTREEPFELPVTYRSAEQFFPAKLVQMGYTYKIYVQVNSTEIVFEPDEERNFRAIIEQQHHAVDANLIAAIGAALEKHLR